MGDLALGYGRIPFITWQKNGKSSVPLGKILVLSRNAQEKLQISQFFLKKWPPVLEKGMEIL